MSTSTIIRFVVLVAMAILIAGCPAKQMEVAPENPDGSATPTPELPEDLVKKDAEGSDTLKTEAEKLRAAASRQRRTYLIGPEDVLRVKVWMREDLSKEGAVRDDGTFFVPLAGNMKAEGLTATQFQTALIQQLAQYLRSPQVDVEIIEYKSKVYYLVGQFREPGMYPVKATTTLMEAVTSAKGFSDRANVGQAYLLHQGNIVPVDFVALFKQGQMQYNVHLDDGDVVYVPNMDLTRVYVLGEVLRPTAVPIRAGRITVAEAIAEAGGFNEVTAYKNGVRIIRGSLAEPEVYTVNFHEAMKGRSAQAILLEPGDIVYVPSSGLAKWDRVLGQILPSLSRIVVDAAAIDSLTNR